WSVQAIDAAFTGSPFASQEVFTVGEITNTLLLASPNGGENFAVGSIQYLAWTNTNMTGSVNIDYSTDNGTNWLSVATNLPSMYPTYMWTIPNTPSTTCKIKVYDAANSSIFDESDNVFTISAASQITGLVAHYKFNGDASDNSGNGLNGTVNGGTQLVEDRFHNPNSAYSFYDNSSIKVPHSPQLNFPGGQFTFAVWMTQAGSSSTFNCILGKDYTKEFGFGTWGTNCQAPTYPRLIVGGVETTTSNLSPINCNTWYHLAVTFDEAKDEVQFYINGVLTETATNAGLMTATASEMGIGQDGMYIDQFYGVLDDIRIFDKVLNATEIAAIFNDSGNQTRTLILGTPNGGEYLVAGTVDTIHW
ncbi:MAG: LamG domain-containing protein, partial [Candidatus Saccharibacteria bacterium]|nr:LamG domain-containing protein [Candidatus Saccharibacteria bacterium]